MRTREESLKIISDAIGGNAYAANDINQNEQNNASQQNTGMRSREESLRIIQSAMGGGSTADATPQQTTPQPTTPQSAPLTAPLAQGSLAGGRSAEQIQQEISDSRRRLEQLQSDAAYVLTAEPGAELGRQMDAERARIKALNEELNALKTPSTNAERDSLIRRMNAITENEGYATTVELADAVQQEKQDTRQRLHQLDEELGNAARFYDSGERAGAVVKGALKQTGSAYTNFMGTLQGVGNRLHEASSAADQAVAGSDYAGWATDELTAANMAEAIMKENPDGNYLEGLQKEEQRLYEKADTVAASAAKDIEQAKEGLSALGQAGVDISTNLIQMGIDAAGRAAGLGMLPFFVRAAGGSMQEARHAGASTGQQFAYGLTKGAIEVGTEKLFDGLAGVFGKGAADDVIEGLIGKLSGSNTGRSLLRAFAGAAGEGTEEVISDLLDPFAKLIYNDQALKEAWENRAELRSQMLYDYLLGAAMGGFGSVTGAATGQYAEKNAALGGTEMQEQTGAEAQAAGVTDTEATPQSAPLTAPLAQGSQTAQTDAPTAPVTGEPLQEAQTQAAETAQNAQRATPQAETPPTTENAVQAAPEALNRQAETNAQEQETAKEQNAAPDASNQTTAQREQPEGANAVRGFSVNIATDSAMEMALREDMAANPDLYKRLSNKDTLQKAQDIFTQGLDKARSELERAIGAAQSGQKFPPEMVPLSRMVANELTRRGDLPAARKIASDVAAELTGAGQLGQAAAILRNADPITVLDTLQKALDSINKEVSGKQGNSGKRKAADSAGAELENAVKDAAGKIAENEEIRNAVKREIGRSRSGKGKGGEKQEASMAEVLRDALKRDAFSRIKPKTTDPQKELVKSLKRFAMEKLPPKQGAAQKTAADVLSDYVKNQEMFTEAWEDAQKMLREDKEVKGNPIIEEILGGFVNEGINVNANYPAEIRGRIMAKALTEEALNTGETKETIRNQYALGVSVKEIGGRIADSLIQQTGASGEIAETIRDAATAYTEKVISEDTKDAEARANSIVNSAVLSVGETMRSLAKQGQTSKAAIKRAVADVLAFEYAVDPKTAERISETVYELYDAQLKKSMDAEVQRRYGEKEPGRKKPLNESISETINIGAFESEYAEKAADQLAKKAIKELGTTVEKIALGNSAEKTSIRDAVVSLFVSNYGLSKTQAHEIADVVTSQFDNMVSQAANRIIERRFGAKPNRAAQKTDTVQKLIEAVNIGAFNSAYASEAANKLFGLDKIKAGNWKAELTAEEIKQISETDFSQEGAFEAIQQQIAERLGREMPATWAEKLREIRKVGMLANPKTQLKNLFGNAPLAVERKVSERLSGGIQELAVKAGIMAKGEQTRTLRVSQESKDLAKSVYKNNFDRITKKGNKGELRGILRGTRTYFNKGHLQKGIEKATGHQLNDAALDYVRRFTYGLLEKGDAPFVKSAFIDSLAQYCEAQGIKSEADVTETAFSYALDQAMAATFKDASALANLLNSIKDKAGIAGEALDVLFPFTTTPINIAKEFGKYSPLGYLQLLNAKGKSAAEVIDIISRATTGSAVVAAGAILRSLGYITGAADDDKDKAAADKAAGISPYSFGGKYSYEWMQPTGSALAMGAEIYDSAKDGGSLIETISNGIISAGDAYLEQSFYKDIIDLFKGYGSPTENMIRELLTGTASQFIPTIVGATARTIDPTVRTSYSGGNIIDDILAQAKVKTPGISKSAPASVNVRGEEIQRGNLGQRILDNFLLPWTTNRNGGEENAVDEAIDEVYAETGDKTIFRQVSPYKVSYKNETYQMTGEEREQFQKTQGQVHDDILQQIIAGTLWQKMDNDAKVKTMQFANEYALDAAKRELVESRGNEYSSDWDDEAELPDVGDYLAAKTTLKAAQDSKDYTLLDALVDTVTEQKKDVQEKLNKDFSMLDELIYGKQRGVDAETIYTAKTEADTNGSGSISQEELWFYLGLQKNMPEETKDVLWDILTTGKTGYAQYAEKQK